MKNISIGNETHFVSKQTVPLTSFFFGGDFSKPLFNCCQSYALASLTFAPLLSGAISSPLCTTTTSPYLLLSACLDIFPKPGSEGSCRRLIQDVSSALAKAGKYIDGLGKRAGRCECFIFVCGISR